MNPFEHNNLDNFIAGWYISTDLCNTIVDKSEKNLHLFHKGIKPYTNCDLGMLDRDLQHNYFSELSQVIELYKDKYPLCTRDMYTWNMTYPRIQRYEPGEAYLQDHCENDGYKQNVYRHLAYMTYLNDIEDGGGTEFLQQNLTTTAKTGLTIIWPAGWTHYHRGVVSNTTKYIITGWCCFETK